MPESIKGAPALETSPTAPENLHSRCAKCHFLVHLQTCRIVPIIKDPRDDGGCGGRKEPPLMKATYLTRTMIAPCWNLREPHCLELSPIGKSTASKDPIQSFLPTREQSYPTPSRYLTPGHGLSLGRRTSMTCLYTVLICIQYLNGREAVCGLSQLPHTLSDSSGSSTTWPKRFRYSTEIAHRSKREHLIAF